ncbi:hypothetical protein F1559_003602 [Cyanidiococcus yangmingshanensis]|uniref:Uncharacterized protein n=1 Tax=Cyanidiococcus yangmingshanensis TaxID=2690220 RepID=A0A7J7IK50_9RHOD|nr:hypothetical protein F1559_003602 [Cyanidiococcus yangmingshanensis]
MAFVIAVTGRQSTWQHGSIGSVSRRFGLLCGLRRKRGVWFTTASATNENDTEQRASRQRAAAGVTKVNSSEQRPSSSSGATPKRLETIEGSRKFRYVAGNKGPDVWLVVAILSILLPVFFIAYAFKTGIIDPTGY